MKVRAIGMLILSAPVTWAATTTGQETSSLPAAAQPIAVASRAPIISLSTFGYRDGLDFTDLEGRASLSFRVPTGPTLRSARLVLPYTAWSAQPVKRTLTILSGTNVLGQVQIGAAGVVDIPVPLDAVEAGRLPITLAYSGGATPNRCFDRRMSADHVRFDPLGGLALDFTPGATLSIGAAASLIGDRTAIVLPPQPTAEQAAAALSVVAARGGGRLVAAPPLDGSSYVLMGGADQPALRAALSDGVLRLTIGGRDPATAVRAAFSGRLDLLTTPAIDRLTIERHEAKRLTFADLGADSSVRDIASEGGWTIAVPASRLPTGKEIAGLTIDVAAAPTTRGADSVSAWLNGTLLGSTPLASGGRTRLMVRVPSGTTHSMNGIQVRITRGRGDDCADNPRGWPTQLLGTSEVLQRDRSVIDDFNDFASASRDGVNVVMSGPRDLPLAAKAVAGLVGGDVPIRVTYDRIPDEGPTIVISATPPSDVTPALTLRNGRYTLSAADGEVDFDLPQDSTQTIAQLVSANGRPILWIRPGTLQPANLWLDQGDVAVVGSDGTVSAMSTNRPRLDPVGEQREGKSSWRDHRGLLLALAGALIGLIIVLWSFRPSIRKTKPGQGT